LGSFAVQARENASAAHMRHRIEPQSRLKQLPIEFQELARIWGAGIGDDKPDIDIVLFL
jgi:hypothetical protein